MAEDDVKVRLLICAPCKSIEELPWFEGPQERDDTGNFRLSQHRYADGRYHPYTVGDVPEKAWNDPQYQQEIIRQIIANVSGLAESGLGTEFYDVKANFSEDAFKCWQRHNRTLNCGDYKTERMRLLPDTKAERKAEGLDPKARPNTFLCDFCPYKSEVQKRVVKAKGLDA